MHVVTVNVPNFVSPGSDDTMVFVFSDADEADKFAAHMRDLYGFQVDIYVDVVHTYDSAIQAVVEAIGPSKED